MGWLYPRAVPAPYVVAPTLQWEGDTGPWSTFSIQIGTPPQGVRVLPSTTSSEVLVPVPEGCEGVLSDVADCGSLRGINNVASRGFQTNASSTWSTTGIYELALEELLFNTTDNALYGLDTVAVDTAIGSNNFKVTSQTITGVSSANYWLGSLGLGISEAQFLTQDSGIPSLLSSMKGAALVPSLSFGYTAGARYANETPGSLVLGGYDSSRFTSSSLSIPMSGPDNFTQQIAISSILGMNTLNGTRSLIESTEPINFILDSTVADLWLPSHSCDLFVQAFGLTYDSITGLYLVNDTTHSQLTARNPTVTLTVGGTTNLTSTENIIMPFSAFDLNASIPFYNTSTRYFPIRRAANESQFVLGRAFFQEAYVFVDWERQNFTLAQAIHQNSTTEIVPVLPPDNSSDSESHSGLSTGAIAGIAVACCVVLIAIIAFAILLYLRRKRRQKDRTVHELDTEEKHAELESSESQLTEAMSSPIHELHEEPRKPELMDTPIMELQGDHIKQELEGNETKDFTDRKDPEPGNERRVYELP